MRRRTATSPQIHLPLPREPLRADRPGGNAAHRRVVLNQIKDHHLVGRLVALRDKFRGNSDLHRSLAAVHASAVAAHCPASQQDDMRQTDFLREMVSAVPAAFEHADWLASHAYPAADPGPNHPGCAARQPGAASGGCGCWNAPFEAARPWLTIFENESRIARPSPPHLPVIITETGWR